MKGFDEMKINFLTGVFFCFGIYFVLVLFDIYALNREHNNEKDSKIFAEKVKEVRNWWKSYWKNIANLTDEKTARDIYDYFKIDEGRE